MECLGVNNMLILFIMYVSSANRSLSLNWKFNPRVNLIKYWYINVKILEKVTSMLCRA